MVRRLIKLSIAGLLAYLIAVAFLVVNQRTLLFATDDGGSLAAADWIAIAGSQRLALKTPDGETLMAWYVPPRDDRPVFLFLHGKGGGLERKVRRWQQIRGSGAGILAISYRGYPGSTGAPSERGLITDARTAYDWLAARHEPRRIVIHGLSLGTGVAVALATAVDALALILEAPYTAAVDVAAERYPFVPVNWLMWDQFRSRDRIAGVGMPVMIAHGTADTVIPVDHGRRLAARARQPRTYVEIPGGTHSSLVRDGLYAHIWKFLQAAVRPGRQSARLGALRHVETVGLP